MHDIHWMQVEIRVEQKAAHRQKLKCSMVKGDAGSNGAATADQGQETASKEDGNDKKERRKSEGETGKRPAAERDASGGDDKKKAKKAKS